MAPKKLYVGGSEAPPFVVRKPDEDFSQALQAHQQRIMQQPFLLLPSPTGMNEARAAALQEILNGYVPPLAVTSKMSNALSLQSMFDNVDVRSFLRVRPILPDDKNLKVGDASPIQRVAGKREAVLFMPRMHASGTLMDAYSVTVDGCFSGTNNDDDSVYEAIVPALMNCAITGGAAGVVCYGITGSGKTHTAFSLLQCLAQDLEEVMESHKLLVNVVELQQAALIDVLTGEACQIIETEQGIAFQGAQEPEMTSIAMLKKLLNGVLAIRNKHAKASTKTHLMIRISLQNKRTTWNKPGSITIVDLAGAERADESDSRHIGAAFTALKDCIRIRALQKASQTAHEGSVPFRTTNLTFCLKDILEVTNRATKLALVSCLTPHFAHLRASCDTARMATLCCVHAATTDDTKVLPNFKLFTYNDCCEFVQKTSFGRIRRPKSILPPTFDGKCMLKQNEESFIQLLSTPLPVAATGTPAGASIDVPTLASSTTTEAALSSSVRVSITAPVVPLPPPVYPRIARSVYFAMLSIAIATKCLGPAKGGPPTPRTIAPPTRDGGAPATIVLKPPTLLPPTSSRSTAASPREVPAATAVWTKNKLRPVEGTVTVTDHRPASVSLPPIRT